MWKKALPLLMLALLVVVVGCQQSENKTQAILSTLTSQEFAGRAMGSDGGHMAAEYITDYFHQIGLEPYPLDETAGVENVVAIRRGSLGEDAFLVCAHYDGSGTTEDGTLLPSAYDNASGTAAMMGIAADLAAREGELKSDFLFAALDGEEAGLLGSQALAAQLAEHYDHVAVINLDCVGFQGTTGIAVVGSSRDAALRDDLLEADFGLPAFSWPDYPSDHRSFTVYDNMVAVCLADYDLMLSAANYIVHTAEDTAEKLDSALIDQVVRGVSDYIWSYRDRIYEKAESVISPEVESQTDAIYARLEQIQQEKIAEGLAYDEAYCYYDAESDTSYLLCGTKPLSSIEEIKKYFPALPIHEFIGDYELVEAAVQTPEMQAGIIPLSSSDSNYVAGEVYPMSWEDEPANNITLGYRNPDGEPLVVLYQLGESLQQENGQITIEEVGGGKAIHYEGPDGSGFLSLQREFEGYYVSFNFSEWIIGGNGTMLIPQGENTFLSEAEISSFAALVDWLSWDVSNIMNLQH